MHIKLRDKTKTFKNKMDYGTIYFEYSDGLCIALHRSLYTCENGVTNLPYKRYIDLLSIGGKVRRLIKMYYKVENLDDPGNNQDIWVDLKLISSNTSGNIYRYAYNYRNVTGLQITIDKINNVRYIDKNYNVYNIESSDGKIHENQTVCNNIKVYSRDNRFISRTRYNISDPMITKEYLKDDIKIELKDLPSLNYSQNLKDCLVWLNGRFVEISIDSNNDKIGYIVKGIGSTNFNLVGFSGTAPLVPRHTGSKPVASYEIEPSRMVYKPDIDISIFKWESVKISNWIKPFSFIKDNYYYNNNGFSFTVKHSKGIVFPTDIPEDGHMLIYNGVVINKKDYTIVNGSTVILNGIRGNIESTIVSAIAEYGNIPNIPYIVNKHIPRAEDFRLIIFTHADPVKKIKLNRSNINYKNHPYPYHITFTNINVGDLVLLDGIYEKYLLHDVNIIKYPYTSYMSRYTDKNLLSKVNVERLWFNESLNI